LSRAGSSPREQLADAGDERDVSVLRAGGS
jgi:hypothetical protein